METFEQKINVLRNKGVQIVIIYSLVPDDHKPDPELTRITKTTRTLVEGTYGAEIDERISYDPTRDWKMRKYAASSFLHTDLAQRLKEAGIENVLVSGVKTNVCCRHTTVDSASHGFRNHSGQRYAGDQYAGAAGLPPEGIGTSICHSHDL